MTRKFCGKCGSALDANGVCAVCDTGGQNNPFPDLYKNQNQSNGRYANNNGFGIAGSNSGGNAANGNGAVNNGNGSVNNGNGAVNNSNINNLQNAQNGNTNGNRGGKNQLLIILPIMVLATVIIVLVILFASGVIRIPALTPADDVAPPVSSTQNAGDDSQNNGKKEPVTKARNNSPQNEITQDDYFLSEASVLRGTIKTEKYVINGESRDMTVFYLDEDQVVNVPEAFQKSLGSVARFSKMTVFCIDGFVYSDNEYEINGYIGFHSGNDYPSPILLQVTQLHEIDSIPALYEDIPVVSTSCSSDQGGGGENERTYYSDNVIDGDFNTCWMVAGAKGSVAAGSWIQLELGGVKEVHGIKLLNGNGWDGYYKGELVADDLFGKNGRIKSFTLTFSDGSSESFEAKDVRETDFDKNIFIFSKPVRTSYIRLKVDSGYAGWKYDSVVCLSEVAVF